VFVRSKNKRLGAYACAEREREEEEEGEEGRGQTAFSGMIINKRRKKHDPKTRTKSALPKNEKQRDNCRCTCFVVW
jgi:hypothetical protein